MKSIRMLCVALLVSASLGMGDTKAEIQSNEVVIEEVDVRKVVVFEHVLQSHAIYGFSSWREASPIERTAANIEFCYVQAPFSPASCNSEVVGVNVTQIVLLKIPHE